MTTSVKNPTPVKHCPTCTCGTAKKSSTTKKTGGAKPAGKSKAKATKKASPSIMTQQPAKVVVVQAAPQQVQQAQNTQPARNSGGGFWSGLKYLFGGLGHLFGGIAMGFGGACGFAGSLFKGLGCGLMQLAASNNMNGGFGMAGAMYPNTGMYGTYSSGYAMNSGFGGIGNAIGSVGTLGIGAAVGYMLGRDKGHCHGHHHHHHSHRAYVPIGSLAYAPPIGNTIVTLGGCGSNRVSLPLGHIHGSLDPLGHHFGHKRRC